MTVCQPPLPVYLLTQSQGQLAIVVQLQTGTAACALLWVVDNDTPPFPCVAHPQVVNSWGGVCVTCMSSVCVCVYVCVHVRVRVYVCVCVCGTTGSGTI